MSAISRYKEELEQELQACFAGREGFLFNLLRYQLGWTDQDGNPEQTGSRASFHALLAPAVCEAVSGDIKPSLPVAAAVELVYHFSLVHGDVQAGRVDAQSRPSIWWIWGPSQAINAGDGFHAMARVAMMRLGEQGVPPERVLAATEMLDRSCLAMCEGQFSDLAFQDRLLVTTGEYDDMIALKTGALTACAAAGGILAAGGNDDQLATFRKAGQNLGKAWQISRDVADFWGRCGDGITASNVLNKKKSLPLIHALEQAGTSEKRELGTIYMKRVLEGRDMSRVIEIMDSTGARAYSEERAAELVSLAMAAIEGEALEDSHLTGFKQLAKLAVEPASLASD
ncbi:MAG: hypothetical protein F4X65_01525 [Chloroflexi bacterium]|nr:hypothetical protein [Chloroflexota bacterium]